MAELKAGYKGVFCDNCGGRMSVDHSAREYWKMVPAMSGCCVACCLRHERREEMRRMRYMYGRP